MTWINQAGCRIDHASVSIVFDPWIDGTAFNDGWDLIVPSVMRASDLESATHIWFSHEHPDHFSPSVLKRISPAKREFITILFRSTRDRRISRFCYNLGFRVIELDETTPLSLGPNFTVTCHPHGTLDSFIYCDIDGLRILNINDCIFVTDTERVRALSAYRNCHVLMCQFGFAEKVGNEADRPMREKEGAYWISELSKTVAIVQPEFTIPCANFKFFCREDNAYMNVGAATVNQAYSRLIQDGITKPVVLAPGDIWNFSEWDSTRSLSIYGEAWTTKDRRIRSCPTVTVDIIVALNGNFISQVRGDNSRFALILFSILPGRLPFSIARVTVWITDHGIGGQFDLRYGLRLDGSIQREKAEVELNSDILAACLKDLYGLSALIISGCFQGTPYAHRRLFNMAHIRMMNSSKERFDFFYVVTNMLRAVKMVVSKIQRSA